MNRLAIFDCDGTLIDSAATICRVMGGCFADAGLAVPADAAVRRIVGLSLVEAMAALHPSGDIAEHGALAHAYRLRFHRARAEGTVEEPLFLGIGETIDALHADGWLLGVATGKSDRGLALALERHGLGPRFVTFQTADRHPSKPDPSMLHAAMADAGATPATTVMIGDTSFDMAMARAARVRAIGVGWGYHPPDELRAAGADAVAMTAEELAPLIMMENA